MKRFCGWPHVFHKFYLTDMPPTPPTISVSVSLALLALLFLFLGHYLSRSLSLAPSLALSFSTSTPRPLSPCSVSYWEAACEGRANVDLHSFSICHHLDALALSAVAADLASFGTDGKANPAKFSPIAPPQPAVNTGGGRDNGKENSKDGSKVNGQGNGKEEESSKAGEANAVKLLKEPSAATAAAAASNKGVVDGAGGKVGAGDEKRRRLAERLEKRKRKQASATTGVATELTVEASGTVEAVGAARGALGSGNEKQRRLAERLETRKRNAAVKAESKTLKTGTGSGAGIEGKLQTTALCEEEARALNEHEHRVADPSSTSSSPGVAGDESLKSDKWGNDFDVCFDANALLGLGFSGSGSGDGGGGNTGSATGVRVSSIVEGRRAAVSGKIRLQDWLVAVNGKDVSHGTKQKGTFHYMHSTLMAPRLFYASSIFFSLPRSASRSSLASRTRLLHHPHCPISLMVSPPPFHAQWLLRSKVPREPP